MGIKTVGPFSFPHTSQLYYTTFALIAKLTQATSNSYIFYSTWSKTKLSVTFILAAAVIVLPVAASALECNCSGTKSKFFFGIIDNLSPSDRIA